MIEIGAGGLSGNICRPELMKSCGTLLNFMGVCNMLTTPYPSLSKEGSKHLLNRRGDSPPWPGGASGGGMLTTPSLSKEGRKT